MTIQVIIIKRSQTEKPATFTVVPAVDLQSCRRVAEEPTKPAP